MKAPKLYMNQSYADALLKAYPSLEGTIVVQRDPNPSQQAELLHRLNQRLGNPAANTPGKSPAKTCLWAKQRLGSEA